jgi:hypothetical protein
MSETDRLIADAKATWDAVSEAEAAGLLRDIGAKEHESELLMNNAVVRAAFANLLAPGFYYRVMEGGVFMTGFDKR